MTSKQRAYLRALSNKEKTIIMVGKGGVCDGVSKQADEVLRTHELVKGKVLGTSSVGPHEASQEIAIETGAEVVYTIGNKFVLYKENKKCKKIFLPSQKVKKRV